ncbi:MAG: nucleotidyltransferase family protein [Rhodothermaceae bacterium]
MISDKEKILITKLAKKYNVSKLYLFGSTIQKGKDTKDIDLAVDGIDDSIFHKFYSELILNLSKPVDLIDLRKKTLFNESVKSDGVLLYG